jgi:hypothetical protein
MKCEAGCLVALALLIVVPVGLGQTPVVDSTKASVDIYANFVGSWVGTSRYAKNGVEAREHIKLEITEETKKRRLRLEYTYGEKGEQGYERQTRFITLNPLKEEMTSIFTGDDRTPAYHTEGLDEFAKTGYGKFIVINQTKDASGLPTLFRCTYDLGADHFNYDWWQSVDGQTFRLYSVFRFIREGSAGVAGSVQ